jgi:outer membrane protein TolC
MSVHVGVVYETPLDAQRYDAERAQARLDIQIAENDLETARQQLETQFSSLWTQADAATRRVEAAQKTVGISERQFQLERQRFELGSSTPIQVQEAEDSLRQARLRVARAQVDRVQALIAIEDATGALLRRYGRLAAR